MIITRTPLRLTIAGGTSDYRSWVEKHDGACVNFTINKHVYITARRLPQFFDYKTRFSYSVIETVKDTRELQHKAALSVIEHLGMAEESLELQTFADVPGRSGMGSSSAFTVGLLNALSCLKGQPLFAPELAEQAIHIEHNILKETVGMQDQCAAAYGGCRMHRFYQNGEIVSRPIPCDTECFESHLLLFYTGLQRMASEVAATYTPTLAEKTKECFALVRMAEESAGALVKGDYERIGGILNDSWRIKRSLSPSVSNSFLDEVFNRGRLAGAWGGKLLGAGSGGMFIFIAPPEKHGKIRLALADLLYIPLKLTFEGSHVLHYSRE